VALQVKVFGVEATSPRIIAAQLESELNKALGEIVRVGRGSWTSRYPQQAP